MKSGISEEKEELNQQVIRSFNEGYRRSAERDLKKR